MSQNYKDTLNLPRTDFPMKANLAAREPEILSTWEKTRLYQEIQKTREGRELFVLHDGPPFANGDVHMGTALNKILKDFVERSAHVYIAVGEWRAIMQNEQFSALSRFLNLLVKARLLPCAEDFRLPRGEVRLHRKIRARQVQCVFVILAH